MANFVRRRYTESVFYPTLATSHIYSMDPFVAVSMGYHGSLAVSASTNSQLFRLSSRTSLAMSNQRNTTPQDEDSLLQDYSRNVTTKSWALFSGNAAVVSAIPICKSSDRRYGLVIRSIFQGSSGAFIKWTSHTISFILSLALLQVPTFST